MHWYSAINHHAALGEPYVVATVLATTGSAPRPAGTKMVIANQREHDTLGGGQLEHLVIARAKELLGAGLTSQHIEHFPLAAAALQCCGGSVTGLLECFAAPALCVAVFGAGHIGQRVVGLLEELGAHIHWFDGATRHTGDLKARLEGDLQPAARRTPLQVFDDPHSVLATLPRTTQIVILTHDHQLDYALLEAALATGIDKFSGVGMIGSSTKWQRFRARLYSAGFDRAAIDRIRCPLAPGSAIDKQPAAIAIAIVNELLNLAGALQRDAKPDPQHSQALSWQQIKSTLVQGA